MKKLLTLMLSVLLFSGLATTVFAQDLPSIEIPINTVIREPAGTIVSLASENVPQDYLGFICTANAVAENQSSVHPGNELIVSSNGTSITMKDVERAPGVTTPATGTLELGSTVDVSLKMGQDAVFSGGMIVRLDCEQPEDPVYECTALSVVRDSENDKKFTFTTETVTSEGVNIESYVYDFGVAGEDAVITDQATIMKIYEEAGEYKVLVDVNFFLPEEKIVTDSCETVVTITEDPEEPPVETLPATGPAGAIAAVAGMSTLGYGAISFRASKKSLKNKILGKE